MRVDLDIRPGPDDELYLHVAAPGDAYCQLVTWLSGKLLVAQPTASTVDDPAGLAHAAECCDTDGDTERQREQLDRLREYGGLLFKAAFGEAKWQQILAKVVADDAGYLEVAIRGPADDDSAALQALRWEALYDGTRFVVAQGAAYQGRSIPVGVVRLITPTGAVPGDGAAGGSDLPEITHIPKVLFAVGSHLTDQDVRPGAEFMGIMRRLDRHGGYIQTRVLESATRPKLVAELAAFKPDVLHLIGHGEVFEGGQVKVQLRGESGGKHYVSAEELLGAFAEAEHWPTMVVLSACQTATVGGGRMSALPFAARIVAGSRVSHGVPVVVAMAGDISDTACRVFTQALTTAIAHGVPLAKAVIRGRRAAFYNGPGPDARHPAPDSGHWLMPVLFLADCVGEGTCLVRTDPAKATRQRVKRLDLIDEPVFYGRAPFLTALDRLLDADDDLNVLVAYTSNPGRSYGGTRLLRELGARAVRSGVLPVLLGPFDEDPPQSLEKLAEEFAERINEIRANLLDLDRSPSGAVAAARGGASGLPLAQAIRTDLNALVAALPENDPVRYRPAGQPRTILLCHRVDGWNTVLGDLLRLLGQPGLQGGTTPVPVVLTGADVHSLKDAREGRLFGRPPWIGFEPLRRFRGDEDGRDVDNSLRNEDVLAYQWWLLNPPEALDGQQLAFAPRRGAPDDWKNTLRTALKRLDVMYDSVIYDHAAVLPYFLVSANDDFLLASYARVLT